MFQLPKPKDLMKGEVTGFSGFHQISKNRVVSHSSSYIYLNLRFLLFQLISGFQLPKPKDSKKGEIIDPFLKVEIQGVSSDKQEQKSSVIKNNGNMLNEPAHEIMVVIS